MHDIVSHDKAFLGLDAFSKIRMKKFMYYNNSKQNTRRSHMSLCFFEAVVLFKG